jgi:hypothetical protein
VVGGIEAFNLIEHLFLVYEYENMARYRFPNPRRHELVRLKYSIAVV